MKMRGRVFVPKHLNDDAIENRLYRKPSTNTVAAGLLTRFPIKSNTDGGHVNTPSFFTDFKLILVPKLRFGSVCLEVQLPNWHHGKLELAR